jgi:hypothetical protein
VSARRRFALALVLLGTAVSASSVDAHTRSLSYSSWTLDEAGADVRVRVPLLELSRLALDPSLDMGSDGRAARYLAGHLDLIRGGQRCAPTAPPQARPAEKGWAHFQWRVACGAGGEPRIETRILLREAPSHMHFARVVRLGQPAVERVLIEGDTQWTLRADDEPGGTESGGTSLTGYLALGIEHILTGWDHLAFVLALLLLATRLGEVVTLVTSFTVAHSVTLALAVLGVLHPDGAAVEAVIGFSIALVAAENSWLSSGRGRVVPLVTVAGLLLLAALAFAGIGVLTPPALLGLALFSGCHFGLLRRAQSPSRLRAAVAFAFGLVHGFGFAGILAEMTLPTDRLVPALFGFNVGVELGQLGVVALAWPALWWLARASAGSAYRSVAELASAAICGLGLYWFLLRALG